MPNVSPLLPLARPGAGARLLLRCRKAGSDFLILRIRLHSAEWPLHPPRPRRTRFQFRQAIPALPRRVRFDKLPFGILPGEEPVMIFKLASGPRSISELASGDARSYDVDAVVLRT